MSRGRDSKLGALPARRSAGRRTAVGRRAGGTQLGAGAAVGAAAAAVEAGGDHRHPELVGERLVDVRAEDDVGVGVRRLLDHLRRLGDLHQAHVGPAGDREQDRAGAVDRGLEQRRGHRALGREIARVSPVPIPIPSSAWPASRIVVRTSAKSRLIRPGRVISSEIPWTPWRRTSSATWKASIIVVVAGEHREQALVRDHDQRVHLGAQRLDAVLGLLGAAGALEPERLGDDPRRSARRRRGRAARPPAPRRCRCRRRPRRSRTPCRSPSAGA